MKPALRLASLGVTALVLSATGPGGGALPDRLDDATFWRLVSEFSEPGGYFRSDNFISNEGELQYVIPELQRAMGPGRAYIGVGPEQNLTYIAALDPGISFIVDIRRQNLVQHLLFKALMETSPDRATYLARLFSRPRPAGLDSTSGVNDLMRAFSTVVGDTTMFHRTFEEVQLHLVDVHRFALTAEDVESLRYILSAFGTAGTGITYSFGQMGGAGRSGTWMPTLHEIMIETDDAGVERSYLATEAAYRMLKDRQERNLIVPIVGDFAGGKALRAVARWIRSQDAVVGVFYASNVEQYLFQDGIVGRFFENLGTFPIDSASTFVRSASNRGWVPVRNPRSRMAQLTMRIAPMLAAIQAGRVTSYGELVTLVP